MSYAKLYKPHKSRTAFNVITKTVLSKEWYKTISLPWDSADMIFGPLLTVITIQTTNY